MTDHKPIRSIDLNALQATLFEEMDNLMSLDLDSMDRERVELEMTRANAVAGIAGVAIQNANTVVRIVSKQADTLGSASKVPRMIQA